MLEDRLENKIKALNEMARLYESLVKKDYNYNYRLQAIYDQLEILIELRNGSNNIINVWMQCYEEDLRTI